MRILEALATWSFRSKDDESPLADGGRNAVRHPGKPGHSSLATAVPTTSTSSANNTTNPAKNQRLMKAVRLTIEDVGTTKEEHVPCMHATRRVACE